jgi:hypothetical protein
MAQVKGSLAREEEESSCLPDLLLQEQDFESVSESLKKDLMHPVLSFRDGNFGGKKHQEEVGKEIKVQAEGALNGERDWVVNEGHSRDANRGLSGRASTDVSKNVPILGNLDFISAQYVSKGAAPQILKFLVRHASSLHLRYRLLEVFLCNLQLWLCRLGHSFDRVSFSRDWV